MFSECYSKLSKRKITPAVQSHLDDLLNYLRSRSIDPYLFLAVNYTEKQNPTLKGLSGIKALARYNKYIDKLAWIDTKERNSKSENVIMMERLKESLNVVKTLSRGRCHKYNNNFDELVKNENHMFSELLNITRLNLVSSIVLAASPEFRRNFATLDNDYKEIFFPMHLVAVNELELVRKNKDAREYLLKNFGIKL